MAAPLQLPREIGAGRRGLAIATGLMLVGGFAAAPRQSHAQGARYLDPIFAGVTVTPDIVYGRAVDSRTGEEVDLLLDLYEPRGDEAPERGVFVFVHGGGFVKGAKASGRPYGLRMARRGYVAVSIDYRLSQGQGPQRVLAAVSDARQAIGWLQDNAAAYRLDAGHIAVGGSSAGAITALHLAYTDAAVDPGVEPARVAAVMDLWGGLYGRIEELGAGEAPLVIVHGTEDSTVPYSEAVALRDRAEQVGVPYAFHPIEGAGHAPFDPDQHVAWTARFFYDQVWAHGGGATKILVPVALARWPIGPASGK